MACRRGNSRGTAVTCAHRGTADCAVQPNNSPHSVQAYQLPSELVEPSLALPDISPTHKGSSNTAEQGCSFLDVSPEILLSRLPEGDDQGLRLLSLCKALKVWSKGVHCLFTCLQIVKFLPDDCPDCPRSLQLSASAKNTAQPKHQQQQKACIPC